MARLVADENFPFPVVLALRAAGTDVLTAAEAGLLQTPDLSVLASAKALGRAVLTQDRDYIRLHKSGAAHAGIVFTTLDDDFAALAVRVGAAIAGRADLSAQLIRVYRPNAAPPPVP
jgi:predicted nuclease of predicted toxin-antitoxin system